MNKTRKIVVRSGLIGICVFALVNLATAGKPAATARAVTTPVIVTFLSGDVVADPVTLPGPFTATIDFLKYIPYLCPTSPAGGEEVLRFLQTKNPITYTSLAIKVAATPLYSRLDFTAMIDGAKYIITMNAFISGTITSTPELYTAHLYEGRLAIVKDKHLMLTAGDPVRQINLDLTMTK